MRILGKPPAQEFKDLISGLVKGIDDVNEIGRILYLVNNKPELVTIDDVHRLVDLMYELSDILDTIDHEYGIKNKQVLSKIIEELEIHSRQLEGELVEHPERVPVDLIRSMSHRLEPILKMAKRLIISISRDPENDNAGEKRSIKKYVIGGAILVLVTILANTK